MGMKGVDLFAVKWTLDRNVGIANDSKEESKDENAEYIPPSIEMQTMNKKKEKKEKYINEFLRHLKRELRTNVFKHLMPRKRTWYGYSKEKQRRIDALQDEILNHYSVYLQNIKSQSDQYL